MKKKYKIYPVGFDPMVAYSPSNSDDYNFDGHIFSINPTNSPDDIITWTIDDVNDMIDLLKGVFVVEMDVEVDKFLFTGQWRSPALEDISDNEIDFWWSEVPEHEMRKWR